jgi:hypothetical protein
MLVIHSVNLSNKNGKEKLQSTLTLTEECKVKAFSHLSVFITFFERKKTEFTLVIQYHQRKARSKKNSA